MDCCIYLCIYAAMLKSTAKLLHKCRQFFIPAFSVFQCRRLSNLFIMLVLKTFATFANENSLSLDNGQLCFGMPETFSDAQNNLPQSG
jgi:hypothetical protein